ncbi:tyrosine-type recombinase/integrase [Sphingomonas jatrophae]|uniref:Integrase n=1 Tax=Sphingomonas jatrophae TaxID=1166337 RepID=A0A1I6L237_9SPHN|nr:site-specific integrase [Sphingomonas jatrophae]SFR97534.1 Integrase [Sphingomonas jatrophae]
MGKLTVAGVRNAKPGRHADGDGLYLLVKPTGARSWLLRVQVEKRRRDIGLGSVDLTPKPDRDKAIDDIPLLSRKVLSLAEARDKATLLRKVAMAGRDPVVERDKERQKVPTFEAAAIACHADLKSSWTKRHEETFLTSLQRHAYPALGKLQVDQIHAPEIRDLLAPIWAEIPDMARKVRQRVGTVLNYAHSKGWRAAEAPGRSVTVGLARRAASGNLAAMPYAEVPAFVADLASKPETVGRLALLFTIHTAARSGEVRHAQWSHIDIERKLWNRPAELMKSRVPHSVTLTDAAVAVLDRAKTLRKSADDALVFPSTKGKPLSDMTLSKIMRDAKLPFTVHGFRSSFRDWAAEQMPHIPDPVAEAALAHVVPDKVERAYKRTGFLEMRRTLLEGWGRHCSASVVGVA